MINNMKIISQTSNNSNIFTNQNILHYICRFLELSVLLQFAKTSKTIRHVVIHYLYINLDKLYDSFAQNNMNNSKIDTLVSVLLVGDKNKIDAVLNNMLNDTSNNHKKNQLLQIKACLIMKRNDSNQNKTATIRSILDQAAFDC